MTRIDVSGLGEYIREQRSAAQLSLRQLAATAGVSNPYLSQVERGLRKPSAEILNQIAKALRISSETLYVRAGILEERVGDVSVTSALLSDVTLTDGQRQALLEIYAAFQSENRTGLTNPKGTHQDGNHSQEDSGPQAGHPHHHQGSAQDRRRQQDHVNAHASRP